jgi:hypothetical protein
MVSPEFQWEFTVGITEDHEAPTLSGQFPESESVVAKNSVFQLTFSQPIDPLSVLEGDGVVLEQTEPSNPKSQPELTRLISDDLGTVEIIGGVPCGTNACGKTMRCFSEQASWRTRVAGIRDLAGNALESPVTFGWKTSKVTENTTPAIVTVLPKVNASGVRRDAPIRVAFSTIMSATLAPASSIVFPAQWWELSWLRERRASVLSIAHSPFSQETIPIAPVITSDFVTIHQQCFHPCLGP